MEQPGEDMTTYTGEDRRRHWRFDRKFSLDTLIAATLILGAIWGGGSAVLAELRANYAAIDKRVAILEEKATAQKELDKRQDETIRDGQQRIEAALQEIQRTIRDVQRNGGK